MIWDGTLPRLTAIVIPSIISVFFKEYLHSNTGNFGFRQKNKPPVEAKKLFRLLGVEEVHLRASAVACERPPYLTPFLPLV